jgi:predicted Zn-dependent protease
MKRETAPLRRARSIRRPLASSTIAAVLGALLLTPLAVAQAPDDVVFRAMQDELERSMQGLRLESMSPPYYLSYRIQDVDETMIQARYGALTQAERSQQRFFSIDLRVGSPDLDNSGFIGSMRDAFRRRANLADENDYGSLRHDLWLQTDQAYKSALENLSRKQAYLQVHPPQEVIPDFSAAAPHVFAGPPGALEPDLAAWEREVEAAARVFDDFPGLQDWNVAYFGRAATVRYLNSEASRHRKGQATRRLDVSATLQAPDGQRLNGFLAFTARDDYAPPTGAALQSAVRSMATELQAMAAAPRLDEYAGPVLFDGFAAAQLLSQLFVAQLTPPRRPIYAEEWMAQSAPDPKLVGRLQRRVLPPFVTIEDDPTRGSWGAVRLAGSQTVDDEGVPCQPLTLVDKGRLVNLPMSRAPIAKLRGSNGHARVIVNGMIVPTPSNLIVRTSEPVADPIAELRRMAREFGSDYGLLVTRLTDPNVDESYRWNERVTQGPPELLAAPLFVYKVYVSDGHREPVRGLVFEEVSIRTLRDIAAMGKEVAVYNLVQSFGPMDYRYPISIVTPSILVEEMELKANPDREPLAVSGNPMFSR